MDHNTDQYEETEKTLRDKVSIATSKSIDTYISTAPSPTEAFDLISKAVGKDIRTIKRWLNCEGTTSRNLLNLYCFLTNAQTIDDLKKLTPSVVFNYFSKIQSEKEIKEALIVKSKEFDSEAFSHIFNESKIAADIFSFAIQSNGVSTFDMSMKFGQYGDNTVKKYLKCGALEINSDGFYSVSKNFYSTTSFLQDISKYVSKTYSLDDLDIQNRAFVSASINNLTKEGFLLIMEKTQQFKAEIEEIADKHEGNEVIGGFSVTVSDIFDKINSAISSEKDLLQ